MQFKDQLHRTISIDSTPQRIVSLVPSQTELLIDLGLEDRIVGVTKFCVHPTGLRQAKTIVGGTKNYRMEVIESLAPDLIIGNKEENEQQGIEALMGKYPVWMSDIYDLEHSLEMVSSLGQMLGVETKAKQIINQLKSDFSIPLPKKGTAVYLIWKDPVMVAGIDTFIDKMLRFAGFDNLITIPRYPQLSGEELVEMNLAFLLLSSEPFPFNQAHLDHYQRMLPNTKVLLVDGEMFSWYGSRLLQARGYFERL